jgi:hypothetical protein
VKEMAMNSWLMSGRRVTLLAGLTLVAMSIGVARGDPPTGWFPAGSDAKGYEFGTDAAEKHGGKASGTIQAKVPADEKFGTMMQVFRADEYVGKRVRMTAWVKAKDVEDFAGLWMRVDGATRSPLAFDNMGKRAIKGTADWKQYEIVLDVPDNGVVIAFGVLLHGKGQLWVDDFKFETVDKDVSVTAAKVKLENQHDQKIESLDKIPKEPTNLDFEK